MFLLASSALETIKSNEIKHKLINGLQPITIALKIHFCNRDNLNFIISSLYTFICLRDLPHSSSHASPESPKPKKNIGHATSCYCDPYPNEGTRSATPIVLATRTDMNLLIKVQKSAMLVNYVLPARW